MHAIIDGDIVTYRIAFTTQDVPMEVAFYRTNELVERVLADVNATSYSIYLTASGDTTAFRKMVYPSYKENRKAEKPLHYSSIRDFLVREWNAHVVSTIEADDAMGIESQRKNEKSIICTIDKDLDTIPGFHYNFVKELNYAVLSDDAIYNFYKQLLMGDTSDNVQGIKGVGEKKAHKILEGAVGEQELFERVREAYGNDEDMLRTGEVLWILREEQTPYHLTGFGSTLVQSAGIPLSSLWPHQTPSTDVIGVEMWQDGYQLNGADQPDTGEPMEEKLN